ncbi:MAG: EAL domain-containing protein [Lachnospiraceae bacterium]|nr:EAL domain-containing protein [Lachnospiraceae bacterium]
MGKATILIAEDENINRKILGRILSDTYDILYACDGQECMDLLREHVGEISAVLLDIVMPEKDGYEVLREVQSDAELSKIPIIVSSQMSKDEFEIRALELGAQDFISKPYKPDIIRHRLANTIKLRETAALVNLVEKDELTGLYNKQFFFRKVEEKLRTDETGRYDLICLDIERFKLINDTFGLSTGDQLLYHIAGLLINAGGDRTICSHFGADVFFLLQPQDAAFTEETYLDLAEKINAFPIQIQIKVHYGVYHIHDITVPISAMCDRAQLAVDRIKGQYDQLVAYYDDSIRQKLLNERFITDCMKEALESGQFQVYYQPKYELTGETIAGAEALVRWLHPTLGLMQPGSFIPLFEKNGFITQLDRFVWETACKDIRERIDAGKKLIAISVNVSRNDIYNLELVEILYNLVEKYQIPIQYLHLEITETAYTDNPQQIFLVIEKLRKLGFIIEMDDFGSGYSSLNMLAEVPIDILKLDMRFIKNESNSSSGKGILSFIISLAKWLNLAVVAEGVETEEQIASLRTMDCNYVQGYYFARPMTKGDFVKLIDESQLSEMHCKSSVRQEKESDETASRRAHQGRVMLIVDDIEVNRVTLAGAFYEEYQIQEAENGQQAWEYLQKNFEVVDIVLLDLLMPVMDGFQLLKHIRSDERTRQLPVIITSQGDKDGEARSFAMKADDFISKPYNLEVVRHRVKNVMANYYLQQLQEEAFLLERISQMDGQETAVLPSNQPVDIQAELENLRRYFDIVRLVDPRRTSVYPDAHAHKCDIHGCYSVWGKEKRCNNCISLRAVQDQTRYNKLEYSEKGLFFVISQYIRIDEQDAVIEMVTKLDDTYVDNVFERDLLFMKLDELNHRLESDELTGVYNRRHINLYLNTYIKHARKYDRQLGLAMIDLDGLKKINDTYGHLTGDVAIKKVAHILKTNFAASKGDFVARFGGDEFLVVCRNIEMKVFEKRIRSVIDLISRETFPGEEKMRIGFSAGCVGLVEVPGCDADALIAKADERLYRAKESGRSCVVASD